MNRTRTIALPLVAALALLGCKALDVVRTTAVTTFGAGPSVSAGLDPAKLPPERYAFDASAGTLTLSFEVGADSFTYRGAPTPLDTFKKIVASYRPIIG